MKIGALTLGGEKATQEEETGEECGHEQEGEEGGKRGTVKGRLRVEATSGWPEVETCIAAPWDSDIWCLLRGEMPVASRV